MSWATPPPSPPLELSAVAGLRRGAPPCIEGIHAAQLGVCHCDCVLVDVGLNTGDTLTKWARRLYRGHGKKLTPYARERLRHCVADNSTCYYGFEANPAFDRQLHTMETSMLSQGLRVRLFTSTAFSWHDRGHAFLVEPWKLGTRATSSTLEVTNPVRSKLKKSLRWVTNRTTTSAEQYRRVRVASMDASSFVAALVKVSSFVAMKIDIEGSEYRTLAHMLLSNAKALCAVDLIAMEWHEGLGHNRKNDRKALEWLMGQPPCNRTLYGWD